MSPVCLQLRQFFCVVCPTGSRNWEGIDARKFTNRRGGILPASFAWSLTTWKCAGDLHRLSMPDRHSIGSCWIGGWQLRPILTLLDPAVVNQNPDRVGKRREAPDVPNPNASFLRPVSRPGRAGSAGRIRERPGIRLSPYLNSSNPILVVV